MRRDDPNDPEAVVTKIEPEPGTPEYLKLRRDQTFAAKAETRTRQFQPHRQDGKRSGVTRQKQPNVLWPSLGLFVLISQSIAGPQATFVGIDVGAAAGALLWTSFMLCAAGLLFSWVSQSLRWLKDK